MIRFLFACSSLFLFASCAVKRKTESRKVPSSYGNVSTRQTYDVTNTQYQVQSKLFSSTLEQYPLRDSTGVNWAKDWVGTTNFSMRKPNFVVIHHTAQTSCERTLITFTMPSTQVSSHYVICEDGTVHHMLNDYLRGHHAGAGRWGNDTDLNSSSIGIELDNDGIERFTAPQMQSLYTLLDRLKRAYSIPTANFIGHSDFAPNRKDDPNVYFNWKEMADKGFGLWYADTTNVVLPKDFSVNIALRIVGYDITNLGAAITVFKRKYLRREDNIPLSEGDKKVLYALMVKYL